MEDGADTECRKRMSTGLYVSCPPQIKGTLEGCLEMGYQFVVTQITHPNYVRNLLKRKSPPVIGRTDRVLNGNEWSRLIVAELTPNIDIDSEIEHISESSKAILLQELGFATHLGVPAILISLTKPNNVQLARIINERMVSGVFQSVWTNMPMVHPSRFSPIADKKEEMNTWDWWNHFRTYCNYDKRLGLVLELPEAKNTPPEHELDRWVGEPVKALIIPASYFLMNQHNKPVLSKAHQAIIKRFMSLDVQYIIKSDVDGDDSLYVKYLYFLGKKLYDFDTMKDFIQGCEDFLQNPLQPLTEQLEAGVYEVFEKDQIKYDTYQSAITLALGDLPESEDGTVPVIMVVGAGRGPLVQAVLNVSYTLNRKIKIYAVEKNPYAINTLIDRVRNEWDNQVVLINEDMRTYEPPEKADILVSELLGSFGDNELSPECLDGAQRFLKPGGISIPFSYTSYLAPIQSPKLHTAIQTNRPHDKTLLTLYETPYIVRLTNFYQIDSAQELFVFTHPNWAERINNQRYKKLRFTSQQDCLLTGFAGFFESVLYKDVLLSIHPKTHTPNMVSWFPILFSLPQPVHIREGSTIEVSFWRAESSDKVWYEWCLEAPVRTNIMNSNGRSYFIRKH